MSALSGQQRALFGLICANAERRLVLARTARLPGHIRRCIANLRSLGLVQAEAITPAPDWREKLLQLERTSRAGRSPVAPARRPSVPDRAGPGGDGAVSERAGEWPASGAAVAVDVMAPDSRPERLGHNDLGVALKAPPLPSGAGWIERYRARIAAAKDFLHSRGFVARLADREAIVPEWRVPGVGRMSNDQLVAFAVQRGMPE